ncbi:type I-C CRISPR-associated endonuclease Cas1c [Dictyobacter aurantiacus]|uniref:CRISPR-associated endonuclease Cas1 n=1 Tax=Dictyobacter aurantiacus TaxID=1936993 RepID=A0A401ZH73_9CHLR|nr:type I-C CRISPR-associated endonuclease Cas1c [Dictyobacter aurantiacus]GCE06143.1 CRISPR-associated endonuclease Cas1 1 [Dictyobacter aurantiacus]
MKEILNTLYVTTERAYLHLDHDTIRMEAKETKLVQMPLIHLSSIVCFGNILLSPALIHRCAEDGRTIVLLDTHGHFKARIEGPTSGNVLLRQAQYVANSDQTRAFSIARNIVAGKVQNCRQVLMRAYRETENDKDRHVLAAAAIVHANVLKRLEHYTLIEAVRGSEGDAARAYFGAFDSMVREDRTVFTLNGRTRRPPLDRVNALLSFVYTLLRHDCAGALQGVGLDPQVGYLHVLRPGRPALALDLMEELRPIVADRLILSLINRCQIQRDDFIEREGGAIHLTEKARKVVIQAYQNRKQNEVQHRVLSKKIPIGLLPHVQARLLARHLRGDVPDYLPFLYR